MAPHFLRRVQQAMLARPHSRSDRSHAGNSTDSAARDAGGAPPAGTELHVVVVNHAEPHPHAKGEYVCEEVR
jgi:hypothetical protein